MRSRDSDSGASSMKTTSAFVLVLLLSVAAIGQDRLVPSNLFTDHMVLPLGRMCSVFGEAPPGEEITVSIAKAQSSAKTDEQGRFRVVLPPQPPGGPHRLTISGAGSTKVIEDVHFGEVWICSGQSNMEWSVRASRDAEQEIAAANVPTIRLFTVPNRVAREPQTSVDGQWRVASPETVPEFSAVAWFFAKDVVGKTGLVVGLIDATWGGTPIEAWMRDEAFAPIPEADGLVARWKKAEGEFDPAAAKKTHDAALEKWNAEVAAAKQAGKPEPEKPRPPRSPYDSPARPGSLWNGMIAPLLPGAITGCIWYQGESNEQRAHQYRHLFSGMIRDWRIAFEQGDFPFLWVQLAGFRAPPKEPGESLWAELREAQQFALHLPRTGQALAHDLGESNDIHPRNKQEVGARLAIARSRVMAESDNTASGPVVEWCDIAAPHAALLVRGATGGLRTKRGMPPIGFTMAGVDRKFYPAQAEIQGSLIALHCDAVPHPVAVRYAWADHPETNLVDQDGLPLAPFRSDGWPGLTTRPESK